MRTIIPAAAAALLLTVAGVAPSSQLAAQQVDLCWLGDATPSEAAERPSPLGVVAISLGDVEATLCYSRPAARGRTIMGELVPFGEPWRLGANEAASLHLPAAASIGSVALEPGTYSIYAVPGPEQWEFVVNRSWRRNGAPIDEAVRADDSGSFTRTVSVADDMVESFTIRWEAHGETMGHLVMEWEFTRVEVPVHGTGLQR